MTFLQAIILGIVEGVTEYLPISSTAHLVLAASVLKLEQTAFLKSFEVIIQSGAILGVLVLYWKKFLNANVLQRLIVAFIPTGIIGYVLYAIIKEHFIGNTALILWVLGIGGVALIAFEKKFGARAEQDAAAGDTVEALPYRTCIAVGAFQALAVIPGVSRAAATIAGGMLWGVSRTTIVEFSFLLAVPTLVAATGLDVIKNPSVLQDGNATLLSIGFVTAFVMAVLSMKFFLNFTRRHSFLGFGIYRIVAAIIFAILIFNV